MRPVQIEETRLLFNTIYSYLGKDGGITINKKRQRPTEGYVAGICKGPVFPSLESVMSGEVMRWIDSIPEDEYIGAWLSPEGVVYFDRVQVFENLSDALFEAKANNEMAVYDLNGKTVIDVP